MILARAVLTWWFMWTATGLASGLQPTKPFGTEMECVRAREALLTAMTWIGAVDATATKCEEMKK